MTVAQALMWAKRELIASNKTLRVGLEAEILLAYVMGVTREWLHTWGDKQVEPDHFSDFKELIARRISHIPIAYLIQSASFYSRDFYVDSSVLIPRPESEFLIDNLDFYIRKYNVVRVAEIGIGSGILSITLALKYPQLKIIATDISKDALEVAGVNLERFSAIDSTLKERISLRHTSLLDGVDGEFDLLLSNPPYIPKGEKLDLDVLSEPHIALFGGEVGDEILNQIIALGADRRIKILGCEMGCNQRLSMQKTLQHFNYKAEFYRDYARLDRGFVAYQDGLSQ